MPSVQITPPPEAATYIYIYLFLLFYICIYIYILAWTCPVNGQIGSGIDRCVVRIVYPDRYVVWIDMWAKSFILNGMWNQFSCGLMAESLRGLTCSIPDLYVVSHAAFLIVTWSDL